MRRILMLHNRYRTRGGEDESTEAEAELLRQAGHDVRLLEASNHDIRGSIGALRAAVDTTWSQQWYKRVRRELRDHGSEILHVQNFFPQISPSVYYAAAAERVPVVQAVRNYRLVCPSANLFRDGRVCTDCVAKPFKADGIQHRCYRGSALASSTVATMLALHEAFGTWQRRVRCFAAVSDYVRQQLIAGGYRADRIMVKPNFAWPVVDPGDRPRGYFLFVGRLSEEKGLPLLLSAHRLARGRTPLKVIGEGRHPSHLEGVEYLGKLPSSQVLELMGTARAVVMPGQWPEPFGRVAIESFSRGTPVIASNTGGIATIVVHERNGLQFEAGNASALAGAMTRIAEDAGLAERLGTGASLDYRALYTPEANLIRLTQIYDFARGKL